MEFVFQGILVSAIIMVGQDLGVKSQCVQIMNTDAVLEFVLLQTFVIVITLAIVEMIAQLLFV